jgi:hypothetical protein
MLFSKYKWLEKQFHEIKVIPEIISHHKAQGKCYHDKTCIDHAAQARKGSYAYL